MPSAVPLQDPHNGTLASVADAIELTASVGLVYVSDAEPGLRRVRRGERFAYFGADNRAVRDAKALKRIASQERLAPLPCTSN